MANKKRLIDADRLEKIIREHRTTYCHMEYVGKGHICAQWAKKEGKDNVQSEKHL